MLCGILSDDHSTHFKELAMNRENLKKSLLLGVTGGVILAGNCFAAGTAYNMGPNNKNQANASNQMNAPERSGINTGFRSQHPFQNMADQPMTQEPNQTARINQQQNNLEGRISRDNNIDANRQSLRDRMLNRDRYDQGNQNMNRNYRYREDQRQLALWGWGDDKDDTKKNDADTMQDTRKNNTTPPTTTPQPIRNNINKNNGYPLPPSRNESGQLALEMSNDGYYNPTKTPNSRISSQARQNQEQANDRRLTNQGDDYQANQSRFSQRERLQNQRNTDNEGYYIPQYDAGRNGRIINQRLSRLPNEKRHGCAGQNGCG